MNYYQNPNYDNIRTDYNNYNPSPYPLYLENILNLNIGKKAQINITIPTIKEGQNITLEGIIESTGKDYLIIANPNTGKWHIIPIIYIDYLTFEEEVKYK